MTRTKPETATIQASKMMNLTTFDFNDAPIRTLLRDEQPWFVAADVCRVLEITNPRDAVSGLDDDEKMTVANTDSHSGQRGGAQSFNIISESGLYSLVFKSRKPEAKVFRKWVTSEVLPALRETGKYVLPQNDGSEDRVSLLQFVRESCQGWSLDRQIELGLTARRYSKAMGLVFQVERMPGLGRVFTFPRCVLDEVRGLYARTATLTDGDAAELERLLESAWLRDGEADYLPEVMRGMAKTMQLFPSIFSPTASLASERSAFGKLISRYDGCVFPSGLCVTLRRGRYHVRQSRESGMALSSN
jgi:prophage antirepressor-like protein